MNRKKKLLYIGNRLVRHGLPPTSADILPARFEELGFEVIVASDKRNKPLRLLDMLFTVFKNRKDADYILIDTYSTLNFYYAVAVAALARFYSILYIPILHGGNLPERLSKSKRISEKLFQQAKINIAPSAYLKNDFKNAGFLNVIHIPNFLEIESYPFLERRNISYKLLWVRSFDEIYNPKLALKIVEILLKKGKDVSLCMVGPEKDGSLAACKKIVQAKNLPVTFTGILKKEEWISLSRNFDIFINTTNFDNMPVSVMEAMALGIPVISTNVGGLPFLIEHRKTGILLPPNDEQAFVKAIGSLIQDSSQVLSMTKEARKKILTKDWSRVKNLWLSVLT